jgi:hypothetical protein
VRFFSCAARRPGFKEDQGMKMARSNDTDYKDITRTKHRHFASGTSTDHYETKISSPENIGDTKSPIIQLVTFNRENRLRPEPVTIRLSAGIGDTN